MKRPYGLSKRGFEDYIKACSQAGVNPQFGKRPGGSRGSRIMQTIGSAGASAGTHGKEGVDENGYDYAACLDIRSRDLTEEQVHKLMIGLIDNNFAPYLRDRGSFANNIHIHAIYLGVKVKNGTVKRQVVSFFNKRDGLVSNNIEHWLVKNLSEGRERELRALYMKYNRSYGLNWLKERFGSKDMEDCVCHLDENSYGVKFTENEDGG